MVVTIVRFASQPPLDRSEALDHFAGNASRYLHIPGLLWKAYLRAEDGQTIGGAYWWRDRASAEARFNDGWLEGVTAKYGAPPTIEWFETPVVVDGVAKVVRSGPPVGLGEPSTTPDPTDASDDLAGPSAGFQAEADFG